MKTLSAYECSQIKGGEIITLTAVMAVVIIAVMAVVVYRLFMSKEGSTTIPGGFKFTWE
ncbi:MAG: hypothetical protein LKF69_03985 [Bacilli bacterium]|jgi:flagellar basal body-associated protein FliL|nr:hypothetical protein [Bacilli bacterium]MCH4201849.1 hypothetical protein [Bacilli bacterium]MCH4235940.1 hypothetical protein [Bacilli bacterium]HMM00658.1 hypothetical protein [Bacilli bacterium]